MAAFPFPIPEPPSSDRTRVAFAFPPHGFAGSAGSASATTVRLRGAKADGEVEREPIFRVPAWIPIPVEGAAYFVIGSLLGMFLMMTVVTLMAPLGPVSERAATPSVRTLEQGVRQVVVHGPETAAKRAPVAEIDDPPAAPPKIRVVTARSPVARRR